MQKLYIIKIGGNIIDDPFQLNAFVKNISTISDPKILVHGGGKIATELAQKLNVKQTIIDGRRITNADTLDIAVMVYAGLINKTIVAKLQALSCNAVGLSGADNNLIQSQKRQHPEIDFGYVGDVLKNGINSKQFTEILSKGVMPIICPITHDGAGNLLNTNADTIAAKIAIALSPYYQVSLNYCFEKKGVLINQDDDESYIHFINRSKYSELKSNGIINKGMIPKLENAFEALESGVNNVTLCHANYILQQSFKIIGTELVKE